MVNLIDFVVFLDSVLDIKDRSVELISTIVSTKLSPGENILNSDLVHEIIQRILPSHSDWDNLRKEAQEAVRINPSKLIYVSFMDL